MIKKILAVMTALIILLGLCACGAKKQPADGETDPTITAATEQVKKIPEYPVLMTYAEYMKLPPEQMQAYCESFPDMETYMQWFNAAALAHGQGTDSEQNKETLSGNEGQITQPTDSDEAPTEPSQDATKEPVLLTYAEYMALTPQQQQEYYETFPSQEAYMEWFNAAAQDYNQGGNSGSDEPVDNEGQITQPTGSEEKPAEPENPTQATTKPEDSTQAPTEPAEDPTEPTQGQEEEEQVTQPTESEKEDDPTEPTEEQSFLEGFGEAVPGGRD